MKINNTLKQLLGVTLLVSLGACSKSSGNSNNHQNNTIYQPAGYSCFQSTTAADRIVTGHFGNGATLVLKLSPTGAGTQTVQAVGELNIPSIESFFGGSGIYDMGNTTNYNPGAYPYRNGGNALKTCLSTQSLNGSFEWGAGLQDLDIALRVDTTQQRQHGNTTAIRNVYLEMGDRVGGLDTWVSGERIQGQIYMEIQGYPSSVYIVK